MSEMSITPRSKPGYRIGAVNRQITVQIKGFAEDSGYPRLSDFLKQLDAIKVALKHTERLHSRSESSAVDYKIVSLSMASPATVVLEEVPAKAADKLPRIAISKKLVATLS